MLFQHKQDRYNLKTPVLNKYKYWEFIGRVMICLL
jgi:hypothetical protein